MAEPTSGPDPRHIYQNQLSQNIVKTSSGSTITCYTNNLTKSGPILTLIHGYPQSAFIWRHVVPILSKKYDLFVPELPGYGISTACEDGSTKVVGTALLEAMQTVFGIGVAEGSARREVVLGGHDRGARISHRLVVDKDNFPNLDIIGVVMLDIVPTKVQWEAFANPTTAAGYFHWPFLANVDIAVEMLLAFGGDKWCRGALTRLQGSNPEAQALLAADGAADVYASLFAKRETLQGTCEDYAAGAAPAVAQQTEDQEKGRKIEVPALVMFSKEKLGSRLDVAELWKDWMKNPADLLAFGVGNGAGHYLPEEACVVVADAMDAFLQKLLSG